MRPPKIKFEYICDGDESYTETELPTRWGICDTCEGEGTQALHGLDVTDMIHEDPEFREDYMRGHYDTACSGCKGRGMVAVLDRDRVDPEILEAWDDEQQAIAEMRAESEAERRAGA